MTWLPHPPSGMPWAARLTEALTTFKDQTLNAISAIRIKTTQAGRINLTVAALPRIGEVPCDGKLYSRSGLPELARVCDTTFNIAGDPADSFRVPNISFAVPGLEFRISTG